MGAKTGIVVSSNWYILAIKLSAYRRWNVGKDAVGLWTEVDENEAIGNIYQNSELLESVEE